MTCPSCHLATPAAGLCPSCSINLRCEARQGLEALEIYLEALASPLDHPPEAWVDER